MKTIQYIHFTHNDALRILNEMKARFGLMKVKSILRTIAQIVFFVLLAQGSDALVAWLHIPIPGTIVGIIVLFALLQLGVIQLHWIDQGATWLLAQMLLFFIPSTVGIIDYGSLVARSGIPILLTILISLIAVMLCSGFLGQYISKRQAGDRQ
jgi:holin-like protein